MYKELKNEIDRYNATLVAVSKTKSKEDILSIYNQGQRIFGENRVQELVKKNEDLPSDIEWHMIGTLQRNKIKYIAPFISMIHSVDNIKLLEEVDKQAAKNKRIINILLQVKIATETTKHGAGLEEIMELAKSSKLLHNIKVCGIMGMASFTSNTNQVKNEFRELKKIFDKVKSAFFDIPEFKHLSMGMSGDYKIALEEGSTMVRIGSLIFGAR